MSQLNPTPAATTESYTPKTVWVGGLPRVLAERHQLDVQLQAKQAAHAAAKEAKAPVAAKRPLGAPLHSVTKHAGRKPRTANALR